MKNGIFPSFGLIALLMLGLWSGCKGDADQTAAGDSAAEVDLTTRILDKEAFAGGIQKSGAVVIDVRFPADFERDHIDGAININFFDQEFKHKLLDLDRKKKYYLYGKNESGPFTAMQWMIKNDFRDVYILKEGYKTWKTEAAPQ